MSDSCCASACGSEQTLGDARWRRVLWIALGLNAAMFAVEGVAAAQDYARVLKYLQGLPIVREVHVEEAACMGCGAATMKTTTHSARRKRSWKTASFSHRLPSAK